MGITEFKGGNLEIHLLQEYRPSKLSKGQIGIVIERCQDDKGDADAVQGAIHAALEKLGYQEV